MRGVRARNGPPENVIAFPDRTAQAQLFPMTRYRHEIGADESRRIQRFLYVVAAGTTAFALILIVAFLTADRWLLLISHESERRFVDRYVTVVKNQFLEPGDPVLQRYVEDLTHRIAAHMQPPRDLNIRVHVVKGPPNAAATLGGHIFVLEGLLRALDSENSLAMVLAHELAHCINRDPLRSVGRGLLLDIALSSAGGGGLAGSQLLMRRYSREQETVADRDALLALNEQYGHVGGAAGLFEALRPSDVETIRGTGSPVRDILSTHPAIDRRIEAIRASAAGNGWPTLETRPYPDEVRKALGAAGPSSKP
ncbi:MAG: M48 family metalloprotease [Chromatiales bacterium]|nr:M48 family metalloprotease [Chromatiales bacterium]